MRRIDIRWAWTLILGIVVTLSGCAAQHNRAEIRDAITETATVKDIDYDSRTITLASEDGELGTFEVGPEVKRFAEIKKGDVIKVGVYRAIAAEMNKHGEIASAEVKATVKKATPEERPGITAENEVKSTVTVEDIDLQHNLVRIVGPKGGVSVLVIRRPEMQEFIKQLKPGDKVDVTYTIGVVVSLESTP